MEKVENNACDLRPLVIAGVTMVLWASAYSGIRAGLHSYSPAHLAILHYAAAALTLGGYALVKHLRLLCWRDLLVISLLGLVGIAFYGVALNTVSVPSAVASVLINTSPIFVALEARIWLGERVHRIGLLGILISFSGVAVIAWNGATGSGSAFDAHALPIVGAAFAFSLYVVGQKPLLKRYTAVEFATYAVIASACVLLVFFLPGLLEEMWAAPLSDTLAVLYLGVFPGAIGYVTWPMPLPIS